MIRPCMGKIFSVALVAALAGCGAPQSLEVSRSAAAVQFPTPRAPGVPSKALQAETPFVVTFDFDSDVLEPGARETLNNQADWIIAHPSVRLRVYGHADRSGDAGYNAELGLRRAHRVVAYLISRGVDPARLEAVISLGEDLPLVDTSAPLRTNRRAITMVIAAAAPVQEDGSGAWPFSIRHTVPEGDMLPAAAGDAPGFGPDEQTGDGDVF